MGRSRCPVDLRGRSGNRARRPIDAGHLGKHVPPPPNRRPGRAGGFTCRPGRSCRAPFTMETRLAQASLGLGPSSPSGGADPCLCSGAADFQQLRSKGTRPRHQMVRTVQGPGDACARRVSIVKGAQAGAAPTKQVKPPARRSADSGGGGTCFAEMAGINRSPRANPPLLPRRSRERAPPHGWERMVETEGYSHRAILGLSRQAQPPGNDITPILCSSGEPRIRAITDLFGLGLGHSHTRRRCCLRLSYGRRHSFGGSCRTNASVPERGAGEM